MDISMEKLIEIKPEFLENFEIKATLTEVELYGLKLIIAKLMLETNREWGFDSNIGESVDLIDKVSIHRIDSLDILDGANNILYIGGLKVLSIQLTTNNIVLLKCLRDECDDYEDDSSVYYMSL